MIKVLIDDDILIQLGEELKAEKEGYRLDCYYSVDEFLAKSGLYSKETPIFLKSNDSSLKKIQDQGFINIKLNKDKSNEQENIY